jgi:iron complex outermembrane receptor protein
VSLAGFSGFAGDADDCFAPANEAGGPCTNIDETIQEDGETYKLSLQYDIDDERMVYATYSTGFRPGGINRGTQIPDYLSDSITNYEVGFKTQWFDRTLRLNGAIFHQNWEDLQFGLSPPGFQGVTFTFNAGGAEVDGVELDADARLGNWTFSAAGAYIDARLTEDFCNFDADNNPFGCTPSGTDLPVQPHFKGAFTARYEFPLGAWEGFTQGTLKYQSATRPYLTDTDVDAVETLLGGRDLDAFTTVDFSLGASLDDLAIEFFLHNAFDERGELSLGTSCATTYCGQYARSYPNEPRIFGARLSQRF